MNALRHSFRFPIAIAVAAALGATACSDNTVAPGTPALTAAQADSISQVVVADAQGEMDVATSTGTAIYVPGATAPSGAQSSPTAPCVTITPAPPTNSDADRVPDSVRVVFDNCVISYTLGSDTVHGIIDVVDPTATVTDHALRQVFTDFARIHVGLSGRESSITLNGARQVSRDDSQLSATETNLRTDFLFRNGATATHTRTWAVTFTADVAGSIQPDAALPSGSLSIQGTSTWTRGSNTFTLEASTSPALHYNANCSVRPKFDSGTIALVVTRNGVTSHVTIQFTACGQYTVTRS